MRKLFFVSREMCGGENLPADFDLEEFCEKLQGKVSDGEVVPMEDSGAIVNRTAVISDRLISEALGEYYPQ
jgi:hypothetical protein